MIDPFEQYRKNWLRDMHIQARAQQGEANLSSLMTQLKEKGHTVTFDETYHYLEIDMGSPQPLAISIFVAREERPETLLAWVEKAQKVKP